MSDRIIACCILSLVLATTVVAQELTERQMERLLARFPAADVDQDGKLSRDEAAKAWRQIQKQRNAAANVAPGPTHEDVSYGPWKRNVLDLWIPESDEPTPLIVYIHGGGFVAGSKESIRKSKNVQLALDRRVAFASIQYRFRYPDSGDTSDPEKTAIQNILRDSARAIQFLRHHATKYNLDPKRIACYGSSAGAGTSIWLAFHDDLADPKSEDPVLRQSTRVSAAGMLNGQYTYDLTQWDRDFADRMGDIVKTHGRNGKLEPHKFYGLTAQEYAGEDGKLVRADVDMRGLISADDPPVYLMTPNKDVNVTTRGIYNHHPRHAELIEARCQKLGVDVVCFLPKVREQDDLTLKESPDSLMEFFFQKLGVAE